MEILLFIAIQVILIGRNLDMCGIIMKKLILIPQGILITIYGDTILTHLKSYTLIVCLVIFLVFILIKKLLKRQS